MIPVRKVLDIELAELNGDPDGAYIVLFHGFGADFYDLIPLSGIYKKNPRPTWIFPNGPLEVPIAPNWVGKAWFPIDIERLQRAVQSRHFDDISNAFPEELNDARRKAESLLDELNIPRAKLIIGGFSQGAVLATDVALHSPHRCAALLILSGTLANEKEWERLAPLQKGLPFFQSHGTQDPLLPISKAKELEELLIKSGLKGSLHSFNGGHEIPPPVLGALQSFITKILDK